MRGKMGTCLPIVCWAIVALVPAARGSPYSSPYAAVRSSQCLVKKLGASRYFGARDRNDLVGVANVAANVMLNVELSPRGLFSLRVMVTAFATSLADIVLLDDPIASIPRKNAYFLALRECSALSTGRVDQEFVSESLGILNTMENERAPPRYDEPLPPRRSIPFSIRLPGWRLNPENFRPTPLRNPFSPRNYGTMERTEFQPRRTSAQVSPREPSRRRQLSGGVGTSETSRIPGRRDRFVPSPSNAPRARYRNFKSRYSNVSPTKRIVTHFIPSAAEPRTDLPPYDYSSLKSERNPTETPSYKNLSSSSNNATTPAINVQVRDYVAKETENDTTMQMNYRKSLEGTSLPAQTDIDIPSNKNSNPKIFMQSSSSINSQSSAINPPQSEYYLGVSCPPEITSQESYPGKDSYFESETERTPFPPSTDRIPLSSQTKFVDGLYPTDIYQPAKRLSYTNYSVEDGEGTPVQPTRASDLPLYSEDVALDAPFSQPSVPVANAPVHPLQTNHYSLERIISNILTNSTSFKNAFGSEANRPKFISLARTITSQSLSGYEPKIISEALDAVTNAVSTVSAISAENYALAISKALAAVLKLHDIPLFENQSTEKSLLSNFQGTKDDFGQQTNATEMTANSSIKKDGIPFARRRKNSPLNPESPDLVPEDINAEIFSNTLYQKLIGSFRLAYLFCSSDFGTERMQVYFTLIKNSLLTYGNQIASIAASRISKALIEIAHESLCTNYAKVISVEIAEILYANELLGEANAQEITNQFEINASQARLKPEESQGMQGSPIKTDDLPPSNEGSIFTETPVLQSSLSINYSDEPEGSALSPALRRVSTSIKKKYEIENAENDSGHFLDKEQSNRDMPKFGEDLLVEPTDSSAISPFSEPFSNHEGDNYYTIPSTTSHEITAPRYTELAYLTDEVTKIAELTADNSEGELESAQEYLNGNSIDPGKPLGWSNTVLPDILVLRNNPKSAGEDKSLPTATSTPSEKQQTQRNFEFPDTHQEKVLPATTFSRSPSGRHTTPPRPLYKETSRPSKTEVNASLSIARVVSQIAESSITFIRSRNFNMEELCGRLNGYAEMVNIPPVRNCEGPAVIDYLLNVLNSVMKSLKGI